MVDAAADFPFPELEDRTPLQRARLPNARRLAAEGRNGALRRMRAEADASRSLLAEACGLESATARDLRWGPFGAAAAGLDLSPEAFRLLCQFVSFDGDDRGGQSPVRPAGLEEQERLLEDMREAVRVTSGKKVSFHSLSPGRFVMQMGDGSVQWPRSHVSYEHGRFLSRLPPPLKSMLLAAEACLEAHPVNAVRVDLGEAPINGLWCWSGGTSVPSPDPPPFRQALVSPDPLVKGLARVWNLPFLPMRDPYALDQPDAAFDVSALMKLLEACDELLCWIPAPFSTRGYEGPEEKVRRLDSVDYYVTGPMLAVLEELAPARMLLLAAGVRHRGRPEKGPAPFVLWGDGVESDDISTWSEMESPTGSLATPKFTKLLEVLRT